MKFLRPFFLFLVLVTLLSPNTSAQVKISDSGIFAPLLSASYSFHVPQGDLAELFGGCSSIGGSLLFKTSGNWLIGAEGNFMFGQSVKNGDQILARLTTSEGYLIDANGLIADIVYHERGYNFLARLGKVIPVLSPNPNCGFTITAGAGYLQDKIRIHNPGNTAPQIAGDYKKGYDRLNGGFLLSGTLGYMYLSNSRLLNFSLSLEFQQAWTTFYRDRNFDTGLKDDRKMSTQFYGAKLSWILPLYKRAPQEFYLY